MSRMNNLPTSSRSKSKRLEAEVARDAARTRREAFEAMKPPGNPERRKFTAEDLADAVAVYDDYWWHRVVRVNAQTVTIVGMHSPTERIPISQITEWR